MATTIEQQTALDESLVPTESAQRLSASTKGKRPLRATTTAEPTDLQRT
nr:hypothetical protein [Tanacetum cinerariifolium]